MRVVKRSDKNKLKEFYFSYEIANPCCWTGIRDG